MRQTHSQAINITVPKDLLRQVDQMATDDYTSRSDIIRQALLDKLRSRKLQIDEWGDDGNWVTIAEFSDIPSGGVSIADLRKSIERLNGQD